jgi:hypothetical protein
MPKVTLNEVQDGNSMAVGINANSEAIEAAIEKTLSRDGTSPNAMEAALDMNSNRILNLQAGVGVSDAATVGQVQALVDTLANGVPASPETVVVTTNTAILAADSGKRITNAGAVANLTWPLPPAVVGRLYEVQNATDSYTLTIDPDGTDRIGTGAAGKYLRLLNRGITVLECQYAGRWEVTTGTAITELEA